jgi:hypothetical protein
VAGRTRRRDEHIDASTRSRRVSEGRMTMIASATDRAPDGPECSVADSSDDERETLVSVGRSGRSKKESNWSEQGENSVTCTEPWSQVGMRRWAKAPTTETSVTARQAAGECRECEHERSEYPKRAGVQDGRRSGSTCFNHRDRYGDEQHAPASSQSVCDVGPGMKISCLTKCGSSEDHGEQGRNGLVQVAAQSEHAWSLTSPAYRPRGWSGPGASCRSL